MIHSFFQKTTLFLLSVLTAGMLSAREFKPISLAEVEIRSFSGLAFYDDCYTWEFQFARVQHFSRDYFFDGGSSQAESRT